MADDNKDQLKTLTEDDVKRISTESVKVAMAELLKNDEEGNEPDNNTNPYYYEPPNYQPPEPPEPPEPPKQVYYDPRVDDLTKQVRQGAIENANNRFNQGWDKLVNEYPHLNEFSQEAKKKITELHKTGMTIAPEDMAANFVGKKALNEFQKINPNNVNVNPSQINANPGQVDPLKNKDLRKMNDEEFAQWEGKYGKMIID